jgi:hypothetical protein
MGFIEGFQETVSLQLVQSRASALGLVDRGALVHVGPNPFRSISDTISSRNTLLPKSIQEPNALLLVGELTEFVEFLVVSCPRHHGLEALVGHEEEDETRNNEALFLRKKLRRVRFLIRGKKSVRNLFCRNSWGRTKNHVVSQKYKFNFIQKKSKNNCKQ